MFGFLSTFVFFIVAGTLVAIVGLQACHNSTINDCHVFSPSSLLICHAQIYLQAWKGCRHLKRCMWPRITQLPSTT